MTGTKNGIGKCERAPQSAKDWADKENHVALKRNVKRKFTQEAFVRDDLKMSPKENSKYDILICFKKSFPMKEMFL